MVDREEDWKGEVGRKGGREEGERERGESREREGEREGGRERGREGERGGGRIKAECLLILLHFLFTDKIIKTHFRTGLSNLLAFRNVENVSIVYTSRFNYTHALTAHVKYKLPQLVEVPISLKNYSLSERFNFLTHECMHLMANTRLTPLHITVVTSSSVADMGSW